MTPLLKDLTEALVAIPDLVNDEGVLVKTRVEQRAFQMDGEFLAALLAKPSLKSAFFHDVNGTQVFDKVRLVQAITMRDFLPDSFTAYSNKIGLGTAGEALRQMRDVVLDWPYKDCVLAGGMTREDGGGAEAFVNRIVAPDEVLRLEEPKALTGWERWDADAVAAGEPVQVTDISGDESLLIKGNNLFALHSLKAQYAGKIDCIYIDPPYNTGSAADPFSYNNRFKRSTWLTFMKNRLEVSKSLLKDDGALIVAIDENELFYLGALIKELFPNHDVHCITVVHNPRGVQGTNFSYTNEFALFVIPTGKKIINRQPSLETEVDWSPLRNWGGESERHNAKNCFFPILVKDGEIVGVGPRTPDEENPTNFVDDEGIHHIFPIDRNDVERKWRYSTEGIKGIMDVIRAVQTGETYDIQIGKKDRPVKTVWTDTKYDSNAYGKQLLTELVPTTTFSFPKSLWTVYDCLHAITANRPSAIILDFFAGSGTTGHATIELNRRLGGNRKFILVEQMDYVRNTTLERLKKVISDPGETMPHGEPNFGTLLYAELASEGQDFVARLDAAADAEIDTLRDEIAKAPYLRHEVSPDTLKGSDWDMQLPATKRRVLRSTVAADHLYVNVGDMDDEDHGLSNADRALTRAFYGLEKHKA